MDRDQKLAQLELLLAEIREGGRGEVVQDAASPRPSGGLPTAYEYGAGTQYQPLAPRPVEMPSVPSAVVDQYGRPVVYQPTPITPPLPEQTPKFDVLTQRMVGGGVLLLGGGVGGAFLLHAAASAVVPLALIAVIVVSLTYLKTSAKSGGGSNVSVNVNVRTNQRNG